MAIPSVKKPFDLNPAQLALFAGPLKLITTNGPTAEVIKTAATQVVHYGTNHQPPGSENGEEGETLDPFKAQAIEAAYRTNDPTKITPGDPPVTPVYPNTNEDGVLSLDKSDQSKPAHPFSTNPELVDSCTARPQGAVGTPADGGQYQNGPVGEGSGGEDYSVPGGGKMTEADWASMKYVTKADFEHPEMMDAATVDAMDRASGYNGSKIKWTEDGAASGHVENSQHHTGNAFDIDLDGLNTEQRQRVLDSTFKAGFSGFGFYTKNSNMLHVDTRSSGNTWYWGNENGNVPAWARPIWDKHGGTKAVVGMKPFHGKPRGYVGTGEGGVEGAEATGDKTDKTGATGVGSKPIEPHKQGQKAKSNDKDYVTEIVARTAFGESGGDSKAAQAIAAVIMNRAKSGKSFGGVSSSNLADQALAPNQFETWKRPDRLCNLTLGTPNFATCIKYASQAYDGSLEDPTGGALWSKAGEKAKKSWTEAHSYTRKIGKNRFYA